MWDQLVQAVTKAIQRKKEKVNLTRMNITKLPNILTKGAELFTNVNLAENNIKDLSNSSLLSLNNLIKLFLMDNSLTSLPDMTNLFSLEILDLDGNDLGRGSLEKARLPQSLKMVYMNRNALSVFPECLLNLTQCEWLYLAHNEFKDMSTCIPPSLATTATGTATGTASKKIKTIGLSLSLKRLVLSHNKITLLPNEIGALTNLEELWISQNNMIELPESLCLLVHLKHLFIDDNKLIKLPEHLSKLINLVELDAHSNKLIEVPNLCDIPTAETLNFCDNAITDLPHWVSCLPSVKYLDYTQNEIPKAIANATLKNLRKTRSPYVVEARFF